MRRRQFFGVLGGVAAWSAAARAQQARRLTIGFFGNTAAAAGGPRTDAFVQRLQELGWVDGRTVTIEYRLGGGAQRVLRRSCCRIRPAQGRRHRIVRRRDPGDDESDIGHPDCLHDRCGPGRQGPGRISLASQRQCHRPVRPIDRIGRKAGSNSCQDCSGFPPASDPDQCQLFRLCAGVSV